MTGEVHDWDAVRTFLCRITQTDGCLLWTGRLKADGQYGCLDVVNRANRSGRSVMAAHRFAWEVANGRRIPDGYSVDHRCHVPICVNPDHLAIEPPGRNLYRSEAQLRRNLWVPPQFAHAVPQDCGLVPRLPGMENV